jgi:hypothetical protein
MGCNVSLQPRCHEIASGLSSFMSENVISGAFLPVEIAAGQQIKNEIGFKDILVSNLLPSRRIDNSGVNY